MRAEIFYLTGDEHRGRQIESFLKKEVFDGIDVKRSEVPINYGTVDSPSAVDDVLYRYLQYLRAAMTRVEDFRIVVGDSLGHWCYMGYKSGWPTERHIGKFLQISHMDFRSLFPAVAMMDRMVMVPQAIHETLRASREQLWMFRPLDLHGLSLVNFERPDFVQEEVCRIAEQMKNEITKLCARHMQARRLQRPDLSELAGLLGVDSAYLLGHRKHITTRLINLTIKVLSDPVRVGRLSPVVLELNEDAENALKRVRVQVRGPRGVLREPVAEIFDFSNSETRSQQLQLSLIAQAVPYCPLEVRFETASAPEVYAFPIPLMLDVVG
jgi:hypothetical protein